MSKRTEQKGSLSLRSNHMDYDRETLVSNWNEAREAEPKDHDVYGMRERGVKNRSLHQSTYNRILDITNGKSVDKSTCHHYLEQINTKVNFEDKVSRLPMINTSTFHNLEKKRYSRSPERSFGCILPRHPIDHNKRHLDTTYGIDYESPFCPMAITQRKQDTEKEKQHAFEYEQNFRAATKKCHSQFTDVANHAGAWHDESGVYGNSHLKREVFKPTNPITKRLL